MSRDHHRDLEHTGQGHAVRQRAVQRVQVVHDLDRRVKVKGQGQPIRQRGEKHVDLGRDLDGRGQGHEVRALVVPVRRQRDGGSGRR